MLHYQVADLRQHLARALDEVEQGETVYIERRGRTFRLIAEPLPAWPRVAPTLRVLDPSLVEDGWSWEWRGPGQPLELAAHEPTPAYVSGSPSAQLDARSAAKPPLAKTKVAPSSRKARRAPDKAAR